MDCGHFYHATSRIAQTSLKVGLGSSPAGLVKMSEDQTFQNVRERNEPKRGETGMGAPRVKVPIFSLVALLFDCAGPPLLRGSISSPSSW